MSYNARYDILRRRIIGSDQTLHIFPTLGPLSLSVCAHTEVINYQAINNVMNYDILSGPMFRIPTHIFGCGNTSLLSS